MDDLKFIQPQFTCRLFKSSITIKYGYGSIPLNTIFRGMNIHLPAINNHIMTWWFSDNLRLRRRRRRRLGCWSRTWSSARGDGATARLSSCRTSKASLFQGFPFGNHLYIYIIYTLTLRISWDSHIYKYTYIIRRIYVYAYAYACN